MWMGRWAFSGKTWSKKMLRKVWKSCAPSKSTLGMGAPSATDEKPTPAGWSMKSSEALLFQAKSLGGLIGVGLQPAGAHLGEETHHRGASRTAIEPDNYGVVLRVVAAVKVPEEEAALVGHVDGASPLVLAVGGAGRVALRGEGELAGLEGREVVPIGGGRRPAIESVLGVFLVVQVRVDWGRSPAVAAATHERIEQQLRRRSCNQQRPARESLQDTILQR